MKFQRAFPAILLPLILGAATGISAGGSGGTSVAKRGLDGVSFGSDNPNDAVAEFQSANEAVDERLAKRSAMAFAEPLPEARVSRAHRRKQRAARRARARRRMQIIRRIRRQRRRQRRRHRAETTTAHVEPGEPTGTETSTGTTPEPTNVHPLSPPREDGRCGVEFQNAACANDLCCSEFGWCGSLEAHCGPGCQFGCNQPSIVTDTMTETETTSTMIPEPTLSPPRVDGRCGRDFENAACANNLCCSQFGWCGSVEAHCGLGCQSGCSQVPTTDIVVDETETETDTNTPTPTPSLLPLKSGDGAILSCGTPGTFALTYDDGPHPVYTEMILAALAQHGVKATFFWIGVNVANNPSIVKKAYDLGHQIANHSYTHAALTALTPDEARGEIQRTNAAIHDAIQVTPNHFRAPYGSTNASVEETIKGEGMTHILWTYDTNDWQHSDGEEIMEGYEDKMEEYDATVDAPISLQHDIQPSSAMVANDLLAYLTNTDFKFVTVAECLNVAAYH